MELITVDDLTIKQSLWLRNYIHIPWMFRLWSHWGYLNQYH